MNPGLVVKLRPTGPWRIGPDSGARNKVDAVYHSDSLYGAVTSAMARLGSLEEWLDATARSAAPAVSFSSCFPYVDEIGFVTPPRTVWPPTAPAAMSARVRWKSARFVPLGIVQSILAGERLDDAQWTVDGASGCLLPAGRPGPYRTGVRWNAAVDRLSGAAERHSVACLEFREGAGLWTIVSFADDAARERWGDKVQAAFRWLADSGFGGERSRGWGRSAAPEFIEGTLPEMILGAPREIAVAPVEETAAVEAPPVEEPPATPVEEPPVEEPPAGEPPAEEPPAEEPPAPPVQEPAAEEPPSSATEESSSPAAEESSLPAAEELPSAGAEEPPSHSAEEPPSHAAEEPSSHAAEELPSHAAEELPSHAVEEPTSPAAEESAAEESKAAEPEPEPEPLEEASQREKPDIAGFSPAPDDDAAEPATLSAYWLLSLYAPAADDSVDWSRGHYTVLHRGGRVDGSGELKKQVAMVEEGSVLHAASTPRGSAPDVAPEGCAHPVYRAGFAVAIPIGEAR